MVHRCLHVGDARVNAAGLTHGQLVTFDEAGVASRVARDARLSPPGDRRHGATDGLGSVCFGDGRGAVRCEVSGLSAMNGRGYCARAETLIVMSERCSS